MTSSSVMATDHLLFCFHPPLDVIFKMIMIQNGGSERELSLLIRIPPASMMSDLRSLRHRSPANLLIFLSLLLLCILSLLVVLSLLLLLHDLGSSYSSSCCFSSVSSPPLAISPPLSVVLHLGSTLLLHLPKIVKPL